MMIAELWREYKKLKGDESVIIIPVGINNDRSVFLDLSKQNILIYGKRDTASIYVNALAFAVALTESPISTKLIVLGCCHMEDYEGLPHLILPIDNLSEPCEEPGKKGNAAIDWLKTEAERRAELFRNRNCKNISDYNLMLADSENMKLPNIVVIVNDSWISPFDHIGKLFISGHSLGIHMIIYVDEPTESYFLDGSSSALISIEANDELTYRESLSSDEIRLMPVKTDDESWRELINELNSIYENLCAINDQ